MPKRALREHELIDWLRYSAIEFGAPARFVDGLDDLHSLTGANEEINELTEKLEAAQGLLDDVREYIKEADPLEAVENISVLLNGEPQ